VVSAAGEVYGCSLCVRRGIVTLWRGKSIVWKRPKNAAPNSTETGSNRARLYRNRNHCQPRKETGNEARNSSRSCRARAAGESVPSSWPKRTNTRAGSRRSIVRRMWPSVAKESVVRLPPVSQLSAGRVAPPLCCQAATTIVAINRPLRRTSHWPSIHSPILAAQLQLGRH